MIAFSYISSLSPLQLVLLAIASFVTFVVVKIILILRPPAALRNIPRLPLTDIIKPLFEGWPLNKVFFEVELPHARKNPISLVYSIEGWSVIVSRPDLAAKVYANSKVLVKNNFWRRFPDLLPSKLLSESLVFVNGEEHRRHRRVINPAFHRSFPLDKIGGCVNTLLDIVQRRIDASPSPSTPIPMGDLVRRLTVELLGHILLDYDFEALTEKEGDLFVLFEQVLKDFFNPVFFLVPFLDRIGLRPAAHKRAAHLIDELMRVVDIKREQIAQLRAAGQFEEAERRMDLLQLIVEANTALAGEEGNVKGPVLSDIEVRHNMFALYFAGLDNTSSGIGASMFMLAKYPEIQERARREVLEVLGGEGATDGQITTPLQGDLRQMHYLEAVVREALRMYPPPGTVPDRVLTQEMEFDGHILPVGTSVGVNIRPVQYDPVAWPEPTKFDPERFLDEEGHVRPRNDGSFVLFGLGSRQCIGMQMAFTEMKVTLAMMLKRYHLALPSPDIEPETTNTGVLTITNTDIVFTPRV